MILPASTKEYPDHPDFSPIDQTSNRSLTQIVALVRDGARVLDLGCASGYIGHALRERGCTLTGIDINAEALELAKPWYASLHQADLEATPLHDIFADERFDIAIFGDILEHLHDPASMLDRMRAHLDGDAYVIASIPNIGHGAMRLAMLGGHFEYQRYGLLDESHLRFFTLHTIGELFLRAGYHLDRIERVRLPLFAESDLVPLVRREDFDEGVVQAIERDPEHDVLQYVVRARPLSDREHARALAERFTETSQERDRLRAERERLIREHDRVRAALDRREADYAELSTRFEAFAHDVAAQLDDEIARTRAALDADPG